MLQRIDLLTIDNSVVAPGGEDLRFALEARLAIRIVRERIRQHLQRDVAIQPRVARAIDLAHTPFADRGSELVRTQASTRSKGQWSARNYTAQASGYETGCSSSSAIPSADTSGELSAETPASASPAFRYVVSVW